MTTTRKETLFLHDTFCDMGDGFDYGVGSAYFKASPLRQAEARFAYWHDLKDRLDRNTDNVRANAANASELYLDAKQGIDEANAAIAAQRALSSGERSASEAEPGDLFVRAGHFTSVELAQQWCEQNGYHMHHKVTAPFGKGRK